MHLSNKKIKVSFVIPYKKRLDNIKLVFESLANQTMEKDEFEIVIGCMEYSTEYVLMCKIFEKTLNITTVMSSKDWQVAYARNIALRQAVGEVVVLLDADMILPSNFLTNLYDMHFSYGQNQCVVGQMINYDNNTTNVETVDVKPYSHYSEKLGEVENYDNLKVDERCKNPHTIPWAFAWTALIAIPRKTVLDKQLFFDLNFKGYGVEDLEWAYRISQEKIPISVKEDVWGIHLPHPRNLDNNKKAEEVNYNYFLKKWPRNDVELTCAFGDFEGNNNYIQFKNEIFNILKNTDSNFSVIETEENGESMIIVGVIKKNNKIVDKNLKFKTIIKEFPIVGLSLPYRENEISKCIILPSINEFSDKFKNRILSECKRVSQRIP